MKLKTLKKLKVGDNIRFESFDGIKRGKITGIEATCLDVQAVYGDSLKEYFVTPLQVIAKIVKRKKPKLKKIGYAIYNEETTVKEYAAGLVEIVDLGDVALKREKEDTHEVFVRPIVRKK